MVRRGSTVRVRQRALQKRRTSALSRSDRLAQGRSYRGYGAVYGAFKLTHRAPRAQAERLGAVFGCEVGRGEATLDRACEEARLRAPGRVRRVPGAAADSDGRRGAAQA